MKTLALLAFLEGVVLAHSLLNPPATEAGVMTTVAIMLLLAVAIAARICLAKR